MRKAGCEAGTLLFVLFVLSAPVSVRAQDSSLNAPGVVSESQGGGADGTEQPDSADENGGKSVAEQSASGTSAAASEKKMSPGEAAVPAAKRPARPDSARVAELDRVSPEAREKNGDILKFGLEDDISELLGTMTKEKDVRFVDEIYDLFHETKSVALREKILAFFSAIEDPCLEDYAVAVLADPYDEKLSTVSACFGYVQSVRTKAAVPAVVALLEGDSEEYFTGALETLGKIGGPDEAVYISSYIERGELTVAQKQSLVRVLGELHAVETYDTLVSLAEDEDENPFVRMYSAEAIGVMEKSEAVPVLERLFESTDPNLRAYVIKGISHFDTDEARDVIIQGLKDSHYKVRLEAVAAVERNKITEADDYLIYRAKNDSVAAVKTACYGTLAKLGTEKADEYLIGQITDKKVPDGTKARIAGVLLEQKKGTKEITALAEETLKDDRRKQLRYALGKEFAKYDNPEFAGICLLFLGSKDNATVGTGLDMYAKGRYASCDGTVSALADKADLNAKTKNQLAIKAARLLGRDLEKQSEKIAQEKAGADAK